MKNRRISTLLLLASALAAVAAGCGSSNAKLSKSEFIAKADAICKRADKAQAGEAAAYQRAHFRELVKLSTEARVEKMIGAILLPSVLREAKQIEALGVPSGDEAKIKDFISGVEEAVRKAEKNPGSVEGFSGGPFHGVDKLAREYGFKNCSEIT